MKLFMKKIIIFVVCLLGILFFPAFSEAQNRPGIFAFSFSEGYDFFASKRNLKNTSLPMIAISYNLTEKLGIEGLAGIINTHSKKAGNTFVHGNLYLLDGFYRFHQRGRLNPYLLAGLGVTGLKPNGNNEPTQAVNINAGLGALYHIGQNMGLRADVRDLYTFSGGENDILVDFGVSFFTA